MVGRKDSKMGLMRSILWSMLLITHWCLLPTSSSAQDKSSDLDTPHYEVYVFLSASWAGFSRFISRDIDDIKEKSKEETPLTFAYIKGRGVEMVFGPGSRKGTVFQALPKGSLDFIAQKDLLLTSLGVDADEIKTVVIEASCHDHLGGVDAFPKATFVIQKKELMSLPTKYSNAEDIEKIMQLKKNGRLKIIEGFKDKTRVFKITINRITGKARTQ